MTRLRTLPKNLTSYDLLKTAAVVTMIIDHIGYYFFPEEIWFRLIGRLSAPMWLYLIGYARSRDFSPRLWIGAFVLLAGNAIAGMALLPLNILFSILLARAFLNWIMEYCLSEKTRLYVVLFLLVVSSLPFYFFWEYGTLVYLISGYGYLVRRMADGEYSDSRTVKIFGGVAWITHVALALVFMGPSGAQADFVFFGCGLVFAGLYYFRSRAYPVLTSRLPGFAIGLLKIFGRRTLEIYVIHLLLFKALAVYLGIEGFGLFDWRWFDF